VDDVWPMLLKSHLTSCIHEMLSLQPEKRPPATLISNLSRSYCELWNLAVETDLLPSYDQWKDIVRKCPMQKELGYDLARFYTQSSSIDRATGLWKHLLGETGRASINGEADQDESLSGTSLPESAQKNTLINVQKSRVEVTGRLDLRDPNSERGEHDLGIVTLKQLIDEHPSECELSRLLADAYLRKGDTKRQWPAGFNW